MKQNIRDLSPKALEAHFVANGQPKFRAKQVFSWLYREISSFEEMTNLPKALREQLEEEFTMDLPKIVRKQVSKEDGTVKYLLELSDGEQIESVVMYYAHGVTLCASTQVGCRMGCTFCASGLFGLKRHMTPGEILGQVMTASRDLKVRISNIVLMGTGEPLDNYDNVLSFIKIAHEEEGLGLGYRHIALSTCGIVPNIIKLSEERLPLTLCISLHAPNDTLRRQTMPVAKKYTIDEIMDACRVYQEATTRRITFEYALIEGVNDSEACALELSKRLEGLMCHVNLIPVNPVTERGYKRSAKEAVSAFQKKLEACQIPVTVRRELGSDIDAACGQLRNRSIREGEQAAHKG